MSIKPIYWLKCSIDDRVNNFKYQFTLDVDTALQATGQKRYDYQSFFEIHFKGLGGAGKKLDTLLEDNVSGYLEWQATHHQQTQTKNSNDEHTRQLYP